MNKISKFIFNKLEQSIKKDKSKRYILTDYSPNILLDLKLISNESKYLIEESWRVFLLCPPDVGNNLMLKQLPSKYLEEAESIREQLRSVFFPNEYERYSYAAAQDAFSQQEGPLGAISQRLSRVRDVLNRVPWLGSPLFLPRPVSSYQAP